MTGDSVGRRRTLVAGVPKALQDRLVAVVPEGEAVAAVVTDAISRLDAVLATGGDIASGGAGDDLALLEVSVPWWAAEQLDRSIGARPGLTDRSSTLSAALRTHLDALGAEAPAGSGMAAGDVRGEGRSARRGIVLGSFAPDDELAYRARSAPAPAPEPLSPVSWAGRAERSVRRLQTLVGAVSGVGIDVEALFPVDPLEVRGIEPGDVCVGLDPSYADRPLVQPPAIANQVGEVRLSGLTNRIAPTLWATSRLILMQAAAGGRPVRYHDFLLDVMPEAWVIGAGLAHAERKGDRSPFAASARWPKVSRRLSARDADEARDDERVQRLAQAATSFIEYSLIAFPGASGGRGRPVGPRVAVGLAQIWPDQDDLWVGANPAAQPLLTHLHELGTSCAYPHASQAWQAYEAYLMGHARCDEAMDQLHLLSTLESSTSRSDFYERASTFKLTPKQLERLGERVREGKSTKGYATEANGFIGRLREWGLVVMAQGVFGPEALTPGGRDALEAFRRGEMTKPA